MIECAVYYSARLLELSPFAKICHANAMRMHSPLNAQSRYENAERTVTL